MVEEFLNDQDYKDRTSTAFLWNYAMSFFWLKAMEENVIESNKFHCPNCHEDKKHSVRITVEFPNPLIDKYPDIFMEPFICELEFCHICVYEIFKKVYPEMHDDMRENVENEDVEMADALKHGKIICAECGTKMDDGNGFSCQDKEDLK